MGRHDTKRKEIQQPSNISFRSLHKAENTLS